ncbi:DUF4982 domain-containing protein, partial [bacterium]
LPWTWRRARSASEAVPTDESGWQTATREDVFGGRPGFAWFRTTLPSMRPDSRRVLHFEAIDDNATVWVNGTRMIHHEGWNEPFDVPLKDVWRTDGPNEVFVLVENQGGGGGIQAPSSLRVPAAPTVSPESTATYNDRGWRTVHLPHDYVVEGTFDPQADTGHGSLPTPTAWYRKTFTLPKTYKGKSVWIDFDGVYRDSTVYLNGKKLGNHPCGYYGARYDLTTALNYGGKNVLAVHVDPRQFEGWWYEGGGIYRHVWLNAADPVHIEPEGVHIITQVNDPANRKPIQVSVTVSTDLSAPAKAGTSLRTEILKPDGTLALSSTAPFSSGSSFSATTVPIPNPQLWSTENPKLYTIRTYLVRGKEALSHTDQVTTRFGIRHTRWDKDKGFFLNGKPVKLKGTCNHLDHAGVGIAVPDSLQVWRLQQLKKLGSNAVRCSHNPPSKEFLDACDRLGILVMDEVRHFGDHERSKASNNSPSDKLEELRWLVKRDRNHPSVIVWALGNEEGVAGTPAGARIYRDMKRVVDDLDGTRLTTAAWNLGWYQQNGSGPLLDVMGFNYNIGDYDRVRRQYPNKPAVATETASTVSTRGEYVNDPVKTYVSAYDVNHPSWAETAEIAWKAVASRPWMAGAFVWTGFDYKGEPTPYGWPSINSHFGILDMCGFPKDNAWYYRAWWGDKPVAHILPHWNHSGQEGKPINVWVHSNAETVELFLNGKSMGSKPMPRLSHLEWSVPYEAGKLEAVGRTDGKVVARDVVETTGPPASIRLKADRLSLVADGEDVIPVAVEVVDAQGRVVPEADNLVTFSVTSGRIAGVGNGDPSSHEPDRASQRRAFHGLAQVLVGAGYRTGNVVLTAKAGGLRTAMMVIAAKR